MSIEEVTEHLRRVDRALRDGIAVERDELTVNITSLYRRYRWGGDDGPAPLPPKAQRELLVAERTIDPRWADSFKNNRRLIGVYRSETGFYWLLRFESALNEHFLDHIGTAADTETRFGKHKKKRRR